MTFWTQDDHSAPDSFWFTHDEGAAFYTVTLLGEIAARHATNEFGWYPLSDPTDLHPMFTGPDARRAPWSGMLPGDFGIYLRNPVRNVILRSQTESQQFAPFLFNNVFYIGVEDLDGPLSWVEAPGLSDYDYNDMMVRMEQSDVPEPASLLMVGTGLTLAALAVRRRRSGR